MSKLAKSGYFLKILITFIIILIVMAFFGGTVAIIFPGLFIFAIAFRYVLGTNWGESFKLAIINIVFNIIIQLIFLPSLIAEIFSNTKGGSYQWTMHLFLFFGGIIITYIFILRGRSPMGLR